MIVRVQVQRGLDGEEAELMTAELEGDDADVRAAGGLRGVLADLGAEVLALELERSDDATKAPTDTRDLG